MVLKVPGGDILSFNTSQVTVPSIRNTQGGTSFSNGPCSTTPGSVQSKPVPSAATPAYPARVLTRSTGAQSPGRSASAE